MEANGGRRIGFVSTRLSGTDGVSLEAAKWSAVLERRGRVIREEQFSHIHPQIFELGGHRLRLIDRERVGVAS